MNPKLSEALAYCQSTNIDRAVFAVPFPLALEEASGLRVTPVCRGMVLRYPPRELLATASRLWLGCFGANGGWQLPRAAGTLVFVGPHLLLTRRMAMQTLRSGRSNIVCKIDGRYRPLGLWRFFLWRAGESLRRCIRQLPHDSLVRRGLYRLAGMRLAGDWWARVFKRAGAGAKPGGDASRAVGEERYLELFRAALRQSADAKIKPVPRRVLLVNAGLAAGGAERQIVNTLIGLRDSEQCESVTLLAEHIERAPQLDFFRRELERRGIAVAPLRPSVSLADAGLSSLPPAIAELAAELPGSILEEILDLVEELRCRRPSVVHAWQDSTSIKVGIAAVIAGVPRIVLSSRNVAPMHFDYYRDYMRPAYRALAALDGVVFVNNSEAGAADYTRWLDLPRERFVVVRNGVDLADLKRADGGAVREYRRSLGIPDGARVIGSVFRFWAEKRPLLWLQVAAIVAARLPDVHFLVVGEGPMRQEMQAFIDKTGRRERFHLPGTCPDVAMALSAMKVFVLTSEFEGTPNVLLEAQWLGLPVVATDAGGSREALRDGITGRLAANPDAAEIAALVLGYLSDNPVRVEIHGPAFVADSFGARRMVTETAALYGLHSPAVLQTA